MILALFEQVYSYLAPIGLLCFGVGYAMVYRDLYGFVTDIYIMITSLAPGQSYDCPIDNEITLKNMDDICLCQQQQNTIKFRPCAQF